MLLRRARVILVAVTVSATAACGLTEGRQEAEAVADRYFAAIGAGDITGALSLYSERFYKVTPREKWLEWLNDVRARCGAPKSHSQTNWKVMSSVGSNGGTRVTLVYDVRYASCSVSETMMIFKPRGGEMQIEGHFQKADPVDPGGAEPRETKA
jgi:hypothetical protein